MNNAILLPLVLFVGVAIGFVLCALLRANGTDLETEDAKRLDFLHQNKLHLGSNTVDGHTTWAVLQNGKIMDGGMSDSARGAIDGARAAMNAP